jgi:hypothetical protein
VVQGDWLSHPRLEYLGPWGQDVGFKLKCQLTSGRGQAFGDLSLSPNFGAPNTCVPCIIWRKSVQDSDLNLNCFDSFWSGESKRWEPIEQRRLLGGEIQIFWYLRVRGDIHLMTWV